MDSENTYNPLEQHSSFEAAEKLQKGMQGWLLPNGVFYPCGSLDHNNCAKFLCGAGSPEEEQIRKLMELHEIKQFQEGVHDRIKLEKLGGILINGSDAGISRAVAAIDLLPPKQVAALVTLGVEIFQTESFSYSAEAGLYFLELIKDRAEEIRALSSYRSGLNTLRSGQKKLAWTSADEPGKDYLKELSKLGLDDFDFDTHLLMEGLFSLNDFFCQPLSKPIIIEEKSRSDDLKSYYPAKVFDILSRGHAEEVSFAHGQEDEVLRLIPTPYDNNVIVARWSEHSHSGDMFWRQINYIKLNLMSPVQADDFLRKKLIDLAEQDKKGYERALVPFSKLKCKSVNGWDVFGNVVNDMVQL